MYDPNLPNAFVCLCREVLADALTGVYLHGSLAMGCFNPVTSDVDLIVVSERAMSRAQKLHMMERLIGLNGRAPAKGIEMSVVLRSFCDPFVYPTPFELHFSPMHLPLYRADPDAYLQQMQGVDPDLAAHFTMIRQRGVTLYGAPAPDVFGPVDAAYYADSIWLDVQSAQEDVCEHPIYTVLNLCRVLAFLQERLYLSKQEGGEWGLRRLHAPHDALVAQALRCYRSGQAMRPDEALARSFARQMLGEIRRGMACFHHEGGNRHEG